MNQFERIKSIAESLGGGRVKIDSGSELDEELTVSSVIKIGTKVRSDRQEVEPNSGSLFALFKPRALRNALKEARELSNSTPESVVRDLASQWLSVPTLKDSVHRQSDILGFRSASEKVLDRTEIVTCDKCQGNGRFETTRQEKVFNPCPASCSGGIVYEQGYTHAPGTTAHGMPETKSRMCPHCAGQGKVYSHTKDVHQVYSCSPCRGTGKVEKKIFKRNTFYRAYRVETLMAIKGKETVSNSIKLLRRVTKSQELDLDRLRLAASSVNMTTAPERAKLSIKFDMRIPLRRYSFKVAEREIGQVFLIEGISFLAADRPFFDDFVKEKRKQIAGMTGSQFQGVVQGDPFLQFLCHAVNSNLPLDSIDVGWSISPRPLKRLLKTIQKTSGKT